MAQTTRPQSLALPQSTITPRPQAALLRRRLRALLGHALLIAGSVAMSIPMLWMLSTSLKKSGQEWVFPPVWLPEPIWWRNYLEAMDALPVPFYVYVINTFIITAGATCGTLVTSSLAAFAFARLRFPGRNSLFLLVIATMMLPSAVTLIPRFLIFRYLGWLDSFLPLIIPYWFGGTAFSIFLLRQFFMNIPRELDEAARMDGASSMQIFWSVVLPLSGPALATVTIFQVWGHWNEFLDPLIYINSMEHYTIALALRTFQNIRSQRVNYLMATALLQVAPVLILFFSAQKYFIRGIQLSGLSGR
ncbi:MAG: carbohydrate ABC transporter permease [Caldilinea sp. CFX5]|nr:carbohydrate ABC transporter permease [Caldilinea sp. CFX5]